MKFISWNFYFSILEACSFLWSSRQLKFMRRQLSSSEMLHCKMERQILLSDSQDRSFRLSVESLQRLKLRRLKCSNRFKQGMLSWKTVKESCIQYAAYSIPSDWNCASLNRSKKSSNNLMFSFSKSCWCADFYSYFQPVMVQTAIP